MVIEAGLYKVDYGGRQDIYRYCRGQEIVYVCAGEMCGGWLCGGRGFTEEKHTRTLVGFISWEERKS